MGVLPSSYIIFLIFQFVICEERLLVQTNVGKIQGLKADDGDYNMYLGIPYARVNPNNPFGPSTAYPSFDDIYVANDDSSMCPQVNGNNKSKPIMGSLDCLKLNIYVPNSPNITNFPVMIWIYGGGFSFGQFGRYYYGPNYLVKHDVVVVSLNYRTGPYGFMCLDIPEVSGNQGLQDQYLALKWVKDNIKDFRGNPEQITLFGQSAGGHAIDLHLRSTKEILYNKVILQSGSAEALTMLYEPDRLAPIKMANYIGFKTNNTKDALSYLAITDTNTVINAATNLKILFKPCVETVFENTEPFIENAWINSEVPKIKDIPVLMGFSRLEMAGDVLNRPEAYFKNLTIVNDKVKQIFNLTNQDLDEMNNIVSNFYFGNEEMTKSLKLEVARLSSDMNYIHPVHRTMQKYLESGASKIYFYMFAYIGARNALVTTIHDEGSNYTCCAMHADDVGYIFNTHYLRDLNEEDKIFVERMTTMWTNFAKFSDPTPQVNDILPVKWQPVTRDIYHYMHIGKKMALRRRPLHTRMTFWDLFFKHNQKSLKYYSSFD